MKPVLVLQHLIGDGPSHLATWLRRHGVPVDIRCTEAGDGFPASIHAYGALAVLGGAMSANDDAPGLRRSEDLIRQAMALGSPVIGHCLGGQLMARALGARIRPSPAAEVGWQRIEVDDNPAAAAWFGSQGSRMVLQWHYEAFDLPPGAIRLATSPACAQQAFSIGPHLAMQFHLEIDAPKLRAWVGALDPGYAAARRTDPATVQSVEDMLAGIDRHLAAHQALADRVYGRWLGAAKK